MHYVRILARRISELSGLREVLTEARQYMNAIRCPNCSVTNQPSAIACHVCGVSFSNIPQTAYVSIPAEQMIEAFSTNRDLSFFDYDTGRKTFMWYRVYCGLMVGLYFLVAATGTIVAIVQPVSPGQPEHESLVMGIVYALLGLIFGTLYLVALFLPRKPFNWIVGIIAIAFGMTSCCFLPALIPLLIFWVKPETKAYFGRT